MQYLSNCYLLKIVMLIEREKNYQTGAYHTQNHIPVVLFSHTPTRSYTTSNSSCIKTSNLVPFFLSFFIVSDSPNKLHTPVHDCDFIRRVRVHERALCLWGTVPWSPSLLTGILVSPRPIFTPPLRVRLCRLLLWTVPLGSRNQPGGCNNCIQSYRVHPTLGTIPWAVSLPQTLGHVLRLWLAAKMGRKSSTWRLKFWVYLKCIWRL